MIDKSDYIDTIKNSLLINILSVLAILLNIFLVISFDLSPYISGMSIASVFFLYITLITYKVQFDFPLFFVRDRLSYWGGLMGGVSSMMAYVPAYLFVMNYDVSPPEIVSIFILAYSFIFILTISFTATIIDDIKHTDYVDVD